MKFRILAALAMLLLSAPSALGVQRALSPTRGELAGWLAALGIELAYLSLAFIEFDDQQRQRSAARVARTAVATAIVLNVLADYAARVPAGLTSAAEFLATFDWLLLSLSVLESAPLAGLAYTLAVLLHTRSSKQHSAADAEHPTVDAQQCSSSAEQHQQHQQYTAQYAAQHTSSSTQYSAASAQYAEQHPAASAVDAQQMRSNEAASTQHSAADTQQMLSSAAASTQHTAQYTEQHPAAPAADAQQHQQQMRSSTQQYTSSSAERPAASAQQHQQYTAVRYFCPRCGAALAQQQYAAARRYGHCVKCKQ